MDSILRDISKLLGFHDDYKAFDQQLIILINMAFLNLTQLGIGPKEGFKITSESNTWNEFSNKLKQEAVKSYIYLRVKILFDPPQISTVLEAYKNQIAELEWRLNHDFELGG